MELIYKPYIKNSNNSLVKRQDNGNPVVILNTAFSIIFTCHFYQFTRLHLSNEVSTEKQWEETVPFVIFTEIYACVPRATRFPVTLHMGKLGRLVVRGHIAL